MMKFQTALVSGLTAALVVPGAVLGQDEVSALENALSGTVRAIEVLSGLETQLDQDPVATVPLLIAATEEPGMTDDTLDERLNSLRSQVSLLRMELDAIESPMAGDPQTATGGAPVGTAPTTGLPPQAPRANDPLANAAGAQAPYVSTGLDPALMARIRQRANGTSATPKTQTGGEGSSEDKAAAPKIGTYSADPLGQARASYNAGRYEDGITILSGRTDVKSRYWTARCLTRLGRYGEAIPILEDITKQAGDSYEGRRAQTDLEFARWKRDFEQKLPDGLRKEPSDR